MSKPRVLFILKRRQDYSTDIVNFRYPEVASGMFNSAKFVSDMLHHLGCHTNVVMVTDNNGIDREVTKHKPTHVFIEGYWVVPSKFEVLKKLHPTVRWTVRCHSELPFLAQEGIAMEWTFGYIQQGVTVAANSPRMYHEFNVMLEPVFGKVVTRNLVSLLSNYYPTNNFTTRVIDQAKPEVNIACFGAYRPLKNHLIQALAAIEFAEQHGKKLRFHINSGRVEQQGNNGLKNLKSLFANLPKHELVEHPWADHSEFIEVLRGMDMSLQVSFTESFNIVTADALSVGTPIVTSSEIPFVYPIYARSTSLESIVTAMNHAWKSYKVLNEASTERLRDYDRASRVLWVSFISDYHLTKEEFADLEERLSTPKFWTLPFYSALLAVKTFFGKFS